MAPGNKQASWPGPATVHEGAFVAVAGSPPIAPTRLSDQDQPAMDLEALIDIKGTGSETAYPFGIEKHEKRPADHSGADVAGVGR